MNVSYKNTSKLKKKRNRSILIFTLVIFVSFISIFYCNYKLNQYKDENTNLKSKINSLDVDINDLKSKNSKLLEQKKDLESKINSLSKQ
ncbi:hypothetical protein UT300019_08070 [Clostridium sp. CTA-19]